jgi:2',3'-cyclic-nucleotide 2'-phosphodiesterase (5'-nucleotidase family)
MRLTILHTNDLHGHVDRLARAATLVRRIRAESGHPVVYVDAGDIEETTNRLSNLSKGTAMQPILSAAGCQAACVGNAVWLRYGAQVLADHAAAATYPLLLANLAPVPGVQPTATIDGVGFVGVTDAFRDFLELGDYGFQPLDEVETVKRHARELRRQGAERVVVLSHLGLGEMPDRRGPRISDRELAAALGGEIDLIVGGHSHNLLPRGEWVDGVLIAQAGWGGEHLGRIDWDADGPRASVVPVGDEIPPDPDVLAAADRAERALDASLDEIVARLDGPLDALRIAEILRLRMGADVGLQTEGAAIDRPLPAGPLRRGDLWEVCHSTGNPGVVPMTGAQLLHVIERGADPAFQQTTAGPLRGRPRGALCVSGPADLDPERQYLVAGTDWELEPYGGMVAEAWKLQVRYDFPIILREAIEEHVAKT